MTRLRLSPVLCALTIFLGSSAPAGAQTPEPALRVVRVSPQGEIAALAQANEIRVVFSEPMVTLGSIPATVTAPFVRVTPAIPGTFRWSGTTVLVFTPDPRRPLPYATKFDVTIDTSAAAVSGRRLARPHTVSFTTPTVKLLSTDWYRRGGRAGAPMVILLRFNQPVRTADVAPHVSAAFESHVWDPPVLPDAARQIDTTNVRLFNEKVAAADAVARSTGPVAIRPTSDWDRKRYPPADDLVAFETTAMVPPEAWVRLTVGPGVPSPAGSERPGTPATYTIQVERAFFVDWFHCVVACAPEDGNPLQFRNDVRSSAFAAAVSVRDVTNGADTAVQKPPAGSRRQPADDDAPDESRLLRLEDAGFERQPPARTYAVTVDASLQSVDGQTLGYTWRGEVENWHERAFTSFGDGHGVWEAGDAASLPFYARNIQTLTQWVGRLSPRELMPTIRKLQRDDGPRFAEPPPGDGTPRRLTVTPDRIQSHGLDISGALENGRGLMWAAVRDGEPIPRARAVLDHEGRTRVRASIVQVTNLGITVKDSPQNTLVFVTRLDTGAPVAGARVSIVPTDNSTFWTGVTGADGTAIAPKTPLRDPDRWWALAFIVTAEKDGDIAYVASDWNEGILPWNFGHGFNLRQAQPMLRGSVFSDRGVYRLGEEIHFKAVLRHNAADGIRLLPEGAPVLVTVRDGQNRLVQERTVRVNAWSSADWTMTLPGQGSLGHYSVRVLLESDKPAPRKPEDLLPHEEPGPYTDARVDYEKAVFGSFLVAAYRRPDFRVDVALTGGDMAGAQVKGVVTAKYLFGAAMSGRPAAWTWTGTPAGGGPSGLADALPDAHRWHFVGYPNPPPQPDVVSRQAKTTGGGLVTLDLATRLDAGMPYIYTLEADVEDVSRQHIANRASIYVHPAPWYIGVRRPSSFVDQKAGLQTAVVTVSPKGEIVSGVPVDITLKRIQWNSVRRSEGNGFYTWDTERREIDAGSWSITTAGEPVPFEAPLGSGGYYELEATARDGEGRRSVTRMSFYAAGDGYTAWERFDHNRIELTSDKVRYQPGDTARVMIQSPWETATALVTTEREGIRSHRQFALTSTQHEIEIPLTELDIPNLFVSVLLIKGRTSMPGAGSSAAASGSPWAIEDASDPGKPAFRLGYLELGIDDRSKRLSVAVSASRQEYRPASDAEVRLHVTDARDRPARSEVTLWAVDYGVLALTSYRTPDILGSVHVPKALQVMNSDSRQRIVSRRVLTPKGEGEGGGGGVADGPDMRRDFRVLAFWLGSVTTDAEGRATVNVKLPESLTTYRIMAVASDRASRFGNGEADVRVNKPLTLKPAFPRFLAVGDTARFGAVVSSQLREAGDAVVTIRSLDPERLELTGPLRQTLRLTPGASVEVRFDAAARAVGRARLQMSVQAGAESDAFEDWIPIEVLASPETVAAHGEAGPDAPRATEALTLPDGVVAGVGGLHVEMSSTAMVGLGEGARYLVEYPYGCAEQKASRALALLLAADLGDAFTLPGLDTARMRPAVQTTLRELELFQCENGGFAYWPGRCGTVSAYLTSYLLHVFRSAAALKYDVTPGMLQRAYSYLDRELAAPPPVNESWWPSYTAWQAFAVKVLVEGGRNQDSNLTRLYGYRERMPIFALAYLHDALLAKGETAGPRVAELRRRLTNAVLPEAGSAHVEELSDPYLLWFWNSNVRSSAIVLNSLVRASAGADEIRPLVRWMMAARKDGRWGNTQENAHAMEALVAYYRRYEATVPDFTALVTLGDEPLARESFRGRSTASVSRDVPMAALVAGRDAGRPPTRPLTFTREGSGTLFYTARLRYAADALYQDGLDAGVRIERTYEPYVETGSRPPSTSFAAGDLVRVTLTLHLTKERRFVAVTDPLPAGFEPLESWFATTARALGRVEAAGDDEDLSWEAWYRRGGFDHVERHDDRVQLFATRLAEGRHQFSYLVRATTAGTFRTAPARGEEMYEPEVFGRTATAVITVRP